MREPERFSDQSFDAVAPYGSLQDLFRDNQPEPWGGLLIFAGKNEHAFTTGTHGLLKYLVIFLGAEQSQLTGKSRN